MKNNLLSIIKTRGFKLLVAAVMCGMCLVACNKDGDNGQAATPVSGEELTGYQFVPLAQYLPGEWRLDPRYVEVEACVRLDTTPLIVLSIPNGIGWTDFYNNFVYLDYYDSPLCGGTEESLVFDTTGNVVFKRSDREDRVYQCVIGNDSTDITIYYPDQNWPDSVIVGVMRCFQISEDSMAVFGYEPRCHMTADLVAFLFHRVKE